ncbi:MAG TPA: ABC transporter permease [Blastocatellia bacterium]|nr:ABC transporter permease [Blastocatellia bacterium]
MADSTRTTRFRFWLWLIALIGEIVPRRLRADWRQEWEAELRYRERLLAEWDRLDWRAKLDLMRRSLSAFWDALVLQPQRLEDEMFQDLRFGLRMLRKHPGFTAVAVITLALGIGANTAIFSVVNAVVLRPLAFKEPDRIVHLWERELKRGLDRYPLAPPNYIDYRDQSHVFEQIGAYRPQNFNFTGDGEPERLDGVCASAGVFAALGVNPFLGRVYGPEEEQPGHNRVVILNHGFWSRRFGSNPTIVGKSLTLNGVPYDVVGVMPAGFQFPSDDEPVALWIPMTFSASEMTNRGFHAFGAVARLKAGVSHAQALAELETIAERLRRQYPATNASYDVKLTPVHEQVVGEARPTLLKLFGAVGLVLLIACANVASLLLSRATTRGREIAVRIALGASRGRILRQLMSENLALSILGGAVGLLLATWSIGLLKQIGAGAIPRLHEIAIDGRALGFSFSLALVASLLAGLAPALQATKAGVSESLKEGARSTAGRGHNRVRRLLVVSEMALSLVLLISAGLLIRSLLLLQGVNPGIRPDNVLTMRVSLSSRRGLQAVNYYQELLRRIRLIPGVESVSAISHLPLSGAMAFVGLTIDGKPAAPGEDRSTHFRAISPDYFRTMGIPLLKGRDFTEQDNERATNVALINETLARRYFHDEDPIGRRLSVTFGDEPAMREIVGVVGDVKHRGLANESGSEVYVPYPQLPLVGMNIVARTAGDPLNVVAAVRNEAFAVDRNQPVANIRTMEQYLADSSARPRFNTVLLGLFAALALALAVIGIYGVMSYFVTQRMHEIGLRLALGARSGDVSRMIVRQGMALTVGGLAIGLALAFAATRLLTKLLYGVGPTDPLTFVVISSLFALVALLACYIPARRAAKVDPILVLRQE